jgi:hypothetical protein
MRFAIGTPISLALSTIMRMMMMVVSTLPVSYRQVPGTTAGASAAAVAFSPAVAVLGT